MSNVNMPIEELCANFCLLAISMFVLSGTVCEISGLNVKKYSIAIFDLKNEGQTRWLGSSTKHHTALARHNFDVHYTGSQIDNASSTK